MVAFSLFINTVQYVVDSPVLKTIKAEYEGPHTLTCERRK